MQRKQELSLRCSPAPPRTEILVRGSPPSPGGQCSWKKAPLAPVPAVGILTRPRGMAQRPLGARPPAVCRSPRALGFAEDALGRAVARSPTAAITMATFLQPRQGRAEKENHV